VIILAKILLVDDDKNICELVSYNLQKEGFAVDTAMDGNEGLKMACSGNYDLVILDIMLPGINGTEICKNLRRESAVARLPIIILSARGDEVDRVVGLEIGADDYVVKPFSPRELLARVNALLRRVEMSASKESDAILSIDGIELDNKTRSVKVAGKNVDFTPKEFAMMELLMRNSGQAFSRDYLLEKIWGYDYVGDTRTVDVHVRHIRQKIEQDPANPKYLQTVRSYGYRFRGKEK
jgi:two-component system alkaline phosphatase synthesis response regulator PhoP